MLRNTFIVLLALLSDLQMLYAERITPRQNPLTANIDWEDFLAQHDMYWNEVKSRSEWNNIFQVLRENNWQFKVSG